MGDVGDERLVGGVAWELVLFECGCRGIDLRVFVAVVEFEFDSNVEVLAVGLECDSCEVEWKCDKSVVLIIGVVRKVLTDVPISEQVFCKVIVTFCHK